MNKQARELNRINNELDKQLNAENNKVMTDIICYLRVANISVYNQEIIRQDLLEMLLSAQERGENVQAVIGEDYKAFCDEIIESLPPQNRKERVLEFFDTVFLCTAILGAINIITSKDTIALIRNLASGEPLNFRISVLAGQLIAYPIIIAAAFIVVRVVCKASFKPEKKQKGGYMKNFLIGASTMAVFLLFAWIGRDALFTINIFAAIALVLVSYIAHRILEANY